MVLFQCMILNLIPSIFISWLICLCFKRSKPAAPPPPTTTTVGQPSSGAITADSINQPTAPTNQNPNAPKKVQFLSDNDPKGDSLYNIKTDMAFPKKNG